MKKEDVFKHRFIVVGTLHYNAIGLCHSLKDAGANVTFVDIEGNTRLSKFASKLIDEFYTTISPDEAIQLVVSKFKEEYKPFIFTGQDCVIDALNNHYDELIKHFHFFHCDIPDNPCKFLDKKHMFQLVEDQGVTPPPAMGGVKTRTSAERSQLSYYYKSYTSGCRCVEERCVYMSQ